jgi:hypothetical protein
MSTIHRRTEERLKTFLKSDQLSQERLASAVLSLAGGYSQVVPRHPEGGRDGGRDLEAILDGKLRVFAGVGFQNNVNNSTSQVQAAKRKFKKDLANARKADPTIVAFAFVTNVRLKLRVCLTDQESSSISS